MGMGRVTKFVMDSFEAEIILDEKTGNGQSIKEIGLFSKNPKGLKNDSPLLMAYRSFAPIIKNNEFSVVVHWCIGFLGLSTNVDDHYTGAPTRDGSPTVHSIGGDSAFDEPGGGGLYI